MVILMNDIQNMIDYIENYGALSFKEMPFNEIDGLIFSQLAYVDFDGIIKNDKIFLADSAMKYYSLHTDEEIEELIGISQKAVKLLMICAKSRRFGWCELSSYVNNVNCNIDKQFSAMSFILNDETSVIAFRGTDATVTGAKESAMLSYMFPVPAQIEALHYFQETAMMSERRIIAVGHSKGGNLAVFAGVNCSNSLKKMLDGIYEYDAPGFPEWFFERYDYRQIADKIYLYTPQGSIIGRMLHHEKAPIIVQSSNTGLKQHQVSSWEINGRNFVTVEQYNHSSDFASSYINELIEYIGEEDLELFFDTIEFVVENMGIDDFYDLKTSEIQKITGLIDSLTTLDEAQKERFKLIIKKVLSDFAKDFFTAKAKDYSTKAKDYFEKIKSRFEVEENKNPDE